MRPPIRVSRGRLRWRWTATADRTADSAEGGAAIRAGWALSAVQAERAGWRAHRDLLGLPRIPANQVPQP